jgi:SOS response regulatory protein OraA/RecX
VETSVIRQVLSESFGEREERERGQALLARRFRGQDLTDLKILQRAVGFLQRRGYTNAVIAELVRQPLEDK